MSHSSTCLNCDQKILGNFCYDCGQKADTHRINLKHFIFHDILHGVWHFEKGILFTIKEALIRPGKAALDYISGKRIKYYNVFYLILILIGLNIFLNHYYNVFSHIYLNTALEPENAYKSKIDAFLHNNAKLLIFSFVPLFAINSFLIFRKKRLNFSEHFIIAGMIYLGVILIVTFGELTGFLDFFRYVSFLSDILTYVIPLSVILYVTFGYYNAFKTDYSKRRFFLKIISFFTLLLFEIGALVVLLIKCYGNIKNVAV